MLPKELRLTLKELFLQKKTLIIVAVAGVIGAACKGYLSLLIRDLMDASSSPEKLKSLAWIGIAVAFGASISRYFHIYLMNIVSEKVTQSLRQQLQSKFLRLNLKFHNNYAAGSGGLISRTMNDLRIIQDGLRLFADLFSAPLLFLFLIGNLFILDARLTIYIFIIVPFLIYFMKKVSVGIRKYSLSGVEQLEKITSVIKESLDGVRTIQSFNLESKMQDRLKVLGDEFVHMRRGIHSRVEIMGPTTELIATFLVLAVIFYFSSAISKGEATAGALIAFITALLQINEPIKKFQEAYVRIQETRVAADRVFTILSEDSEVLESATPQPFPQTWDKIEYKNVSFGYGETNLIKHFNLQVSKGSMVAFVGESGSGKSTLANLLARFYDPNEGSISIGSCDIKEMRLSELRRNIGYVSQDVFLFSDSIENNIKAGIENNLSVIDSAQAAFAHEFIINQADQYNTRVGERGNLLSGGEKQRVGIARALYKDAPILILDEATSALDSVSEIQVQKGLERLMKGRTTFVIAHRLSTIQNADLILVLSKGTVVEMGSHQGLLSKQGEYSRLFQAQMR
ncbi:MAG: ABC transporter ATP-binding protein [Bdellovibrio sp.]|nr:ABC transporter ATP-binding protein [Bdellovibrio sp.]